jgi:hypothetical protein
MNPRPKSKGCNVKKREKKLATWILCCYLETLFRVFSRRLALEAFVPCVCVIGKILRSEHKI